MSNDFIEKAREHLQAAHLLFEHGDDNASAKNPRDIWINVTAPDDDARESALLDVASERSLEILLEHGYSILIMPEHRQALAA